MEVFMSYLGIGLGAIVCIGLLVLSVFIAMFFRRVVPVNQFDVVRQKKTTKIYGPNQQAGTVYYKWPSSWPFIGCDVISMSLSIFSVDLKDYMAYDVGRIPFRINVKAFFQISEPLVAAASIQDFRTFNEQLADILRGAVRKILADHDIEEIMAGRGKFGDAFTAEVSSQLSAWGVKTVKNIEFMDIQDAPESNVIHNLTAKKDSSIEKDSKVAIAENRRIAAEATIEAERSVAFKKQQADQSVGERAAETKKAVGIADQKAQQEIKEQEKATAEKHLAVVRVNEEQQASIDKNVAVILAEQAKQEKTLAAEAELIRQQKEAEGIRVTGTAKAEAEKAMQMAPVEAQLALAREIGTNSEYQQYLISVLGMEVTKVVGSLKAEALAKADVKIIANAGSVVKGAESVLDLFTTKGGTELGGMLEAFTQTEIGQKLIQKFLPKSGQTSELSVSHQ